MGSISGLPMYGRLLFDALRHRGEFEHFRIQLSSRFVHYASLACILSHRLREAFLKRTIPRGLRAVTVFIDVVVLPLILS